MSSSPVKGPDHKSFKKRGFQAVCGGEALVLGEEREALLIQVEHISADKRGLEETA